MELCNEILQNELSENCINSAEANPEKTVELVCYRVLREIREILKNDRLSDTDCFEKIEEMVCLFEQIGSDCGNRHDF